MEQYFEQRPSSDSSPNEIKFRIRGIDFSFMTDSGVFSKKQLDFGSRLLIETVIKDMPKNTGDKLSMLDLGCGYGAAGIILKRVFPWISVTMADINERAVSLAKGNAERNLVRYADIRESDVLSGILDEFDVIITNPPVRAGKKTVFRFYEQSFSHLKKLGILYVVIQRKQGAPSSEAKLKELFGNCEAIEKEAGYWILKSVK